MLRPDIQKVVQEAINQCPVRLTFGVDREDSFSAPPRHTQQRRKYSSQIAGGGSKTDYCTLLPVRRGGGGNKKLRKDDELDDNSCPQDEPDIEESTDAAHYTAARCFNKLEHDPPSDPWKMLDHGY
jgi:ribosome recycling factor